MNTLYGFTEEDYAVFEKAAQILLTQVQISHKEMLKRFKEIFQHIYFEQKKQEAFGKKV